MLLAGHEPCKQMQMKESIKSWCVLASQEDDAVTRLFCLLIPGSLSKDFCHQQFSENVLTSWDVTFLFACKSSAANAGSCGYRYTYTSDQGD